MSFESFGKNRSLFWLGIATNADNITVVSNEYTKYLIDYFFWDMTECSPIGWKLTQSNNGNSSLWIPDNLIDYDCIYRFKKWAQTASQRIWLGTNKYTQQYFYGNEVDYCVAYDWNFDIENFGDVAITNQIRTDIGEAEYFMKYHRQYLSEKEKSDYNARLIKAVLGCIELLPYDIDNFAIISIPATVFGQNKLAPRLAGQISCELQLPLIKPTLYKEKPAIKGQNIDNKIRLWRSILHNSDWLYLSDEEKQIIKQTRKILIIDDLYQSGASIWCLAEYLKSEFNVNIVLAATTVKSLRDGDNS